MSSKRTARASNKKSGKFDLYTLFLLLYNSIYLIVSYYWLFYGDTISDTSLIGQFVQYQFWGTLINLLLLAYFQKRYRPVGVRNTLSIIMIVVSLLLFFYWLVMLFTI